MSESPNGIVLLAKQSGITSFSSLWQIKNALGTKKIGHTGTLDTFADGLLVALSGKLTRLVSFITDCDKEYLASIRFGVETDTLDPEGIPVRNAPLPTFSAIKEVLPSFCGTILQRPPIYSALRVDGTRASDRVRKGEIPEMPLRPVTIYSIDILAAYAADETYAIDSSAVLQLDLCVRCSKGTYIRSLARDIAIALDSAASLSALRRTRVGPFDLEAAAGFSMLADFATVPPQRYGVGDRPPRVPPSEIHDRTVAFTPEMAELVGLFSVEINQTRIKDFNNGKTPEYSWFLSEKDYFVQRISSERKFAVFGNGDFLGVVSAAEHGPIYDFVIGGDR